MLTSRVSDPSPTPFSEKKNLRKIVRLKILTIYRNNLYIWKVSPTVDRRIDRTLTNHGPSQFEDLLLTTELVVSRTVVIDQW